MRGFAESVKHPVRHSIALQVNTVYRESIRQTPSSLTSPQSAPKSKPRKAGQTSSRQLALPCSPSNERVRRHRLDLREAAHVNVRNSVRTYKKILAEYVLGNPNVQGCLIYFLGGVVRALAISGPCTRRAASITRHVRWTYKLNLSLGLALCQCTQW